MNANPLQESAARGKNAAIAMLGVEEEIRNAALQAMADILLAETGRILEENARDAAAARKDVDTGRLSGSLYKRLLLDREKIRGMAEGLRSIAALPDPVNQVQKKTLLDEGLVLTRLSTPLGLLGIIFESRPDVVPQVMGLAVKSANAVIFKGGSEAAASNRILFELLYQAGLKAGLPEHFAGMVSTREDVANMLRLDEYFDLLIPRGSNSLVRSIMENTRIPVLGHADGICTLYVDGAADPEMAVRIAVDAKTQYPAVCNAIENLLVDESLAPAFLPLVAAALMERGVELRGDAAARALVPSMKPATEEDWETEYNDLILAVKLVSGVEEAVAFINTCGSGHTDAIVTASPERARFFRTMVDSSSVMVNASTRFADGYRYGLGAEIGISTNKTHARGPVGLEGLVIYKYLLEGNGQVVAEYNGPDGKPFLHRPL